MFKKIIEVSLPYRICEKCRLFELTDTTLVAGGEPIHTTFRCANEEFCRAILDNVGLESAE